MGEGPAQAKARWRAVRAGVQMVPPPQLASAARPEGSMQVGLAIPVRAIPPQTIQLGTIPPRTVLPWVIPARMWAIPARIMTRSAQMMQTVFAAAGSARPPEVEARMLEQPCPAEELQPLTDRPSIRRAVQAVALETVRRRVWLSVLQLASGLVG
jgi:hypothetical protein